MSSSREFRRYGSFQVSRIREETANGGFVLVCLSTASGSAKLWKLTLSRNAQNGISDQKSEMRVEKLRRKS